MIAYHGKQEVKDLYLLRVGAHEVADEIIHGKYWQDGKGCAVGCTVHSDDHEAFETELGIPIMLARLEDRLFEGQRNGLAKTFPRRFLEAITPGADLSLVGWKFLHWLLTDHLAARDDPRVAKQIKACVDVLVPLTKGESIDREQARRIRDEAWSARNNLRAYAAAATAYAAAYAAAATAYAAAYAAAATAYAAAYADADADADAARSKCYEQMAEKLIELLREAI